MARAVDRLGVHAVGRDRHRGQIGEKFRMPNADRRPSNNKLKCSS
jgi:hypothetical protein